jgi:hypothetical protein
MLPNRDYYITIHAVAFRTTPMAGVMESMFDITLSRIRLRYVSIALSALDTPSTFTKKLALSLNNVFVPIIAL